MTADAIEWINHAGFVLESAGVRLACDPWIEGTAFNNSWALLSKSSFDYADFAGLDYVWLSHEHPDHFSIPTLRKIPKELRSRPLFLFQETLDKRVVKYLTGNGFRVRELKSMERTPLSGGVAVTCGVVGADSFLLIETPQRTYLNMNDVVSNDSLAFHKRTAALLNRHIDVLLVQFSYANWAGNPGDTDSMADAARLKREQIDIQIEAYKPGIVIPFASFVWFCHEENFHLNAGANQIRDIHRLIEAHGVPPVVLYPGDRYEVGAAHDSESAITRYEADLRAIDRPLFLTGTALPWPDLRQLFEKHDQTIAAKNWIAALRPLQWAGWLRPVRIFLSDLQRGFCYSVGRGVIDDNVPRAQCDVELSSESMAAILKNGYGFDTLYISGRLRTLSPHGLPQLSRNFAVLRYNERGFTLPKAFFSTQFWSARAI